MHDSKNGYTPEFQDLLQRAEELAPSISFRDYAAVNLQRHEDWPKEPNISIDMWDLNAWAVAISEETGELCGAIKRLNRFRAGYKITRRKSRVESEEEGLKGIKEEIGGIVCYLDLLAQHVGLTLEECVRDTFNEVSERENFPHRV